MAKNPKNRIIIKSIVIFILILFLIIPTLMINGLVSERKNRQWEAFNEVSSKWAFNQTVTGPVVSIPYLELFRDTSGKVFKYRKHIHILPDELSVNGRLFPEKRYRSIFEVIVYNSKISLSGSFSNLSALLPGIPKENMLFNEAFVSLGISDLRGIEEQVNIKWNKENYSFNSGLLTNDIMSSGITAMVPVATTDSVPDKVNFNVDIQLKGSEMIQFTPVGKETRVTINSNWNNPSFDGAFLPDQRVVADTGFTAYWKVLHLNRNYPQKWQNDQYNLTESNFGIKLIVPADNYLKTDRTIKYALLFIALTFLIYFFLELLNNISVHPFQYVLIGFALCMFYVLLLSISEHITFNLAYLIATVLTIGLIYWYSRSILKENKLSALVGGTLTILYSFIFVIIQMEDYALLIGSLGLFIILVMVMYYSKKIDWNNLGGQPAPEPPKNDVGPIA